MPKKKKAKLPKKVLGVKLPKKARKGPIAEFVMSPVGQGLIAEAVYQLGAAFARRHSKGGSEMRNPMESLRESGLGGRNGRRFDRRGEGGGSDLYHALGTAAAHFVRTLQEGRSHRHDDDLDETSKGDHDRASRDDEGDRAPQ